MRMLRRCLLALSLVVFAGAAWGLQPPLADAGMEARAQALFQQVRCLTCEGQNIADSHAPIADDLKLYIRQRIVAGDDDMAILDGLAQRYGSGVLMRPPVEASTWLLWAGPGLFLLIGLVVMLRRRRA